jgi:hypothetical protein
MKPQTYNFVFVNTHKGHYETYNMIETNIPLSDLSIIENKQNLSRNNTNHAISFVKAANNFYYEQGDRYMKILGEEMNEPIEGYPVYYGFSGNY